jgi:hypothetical protein
MFQERTGAGMDLLWVSVLDIVVKGWG